jgi:hypothetical protein
MKIEGVDPSDFYTVITALRGPDFEAQALKRAFTARIRAIVREIWDIPMYGDTRSRELTTDDVEQAYNEACEFVHTHPKCYAHWREHTSAALDVLKRYVTSELIYELVMLRDLLWSPAGWVERFEHYLRQRYECVV